MQMTESFLPTMNRVEINDIITGFGDDGPVLVSPFIVRNIVHIGRLVTLTLETAEGNTFSVSVRGSMPVTLQPPF